MNIERTPNVPQGQAFMDYWEPVERANSRCLWQSAMDKLIVLTDVVDPNDLRELSDKELDSWERKFNFFGLDMYSFHQMMMNPCKESLLRVLRPYIRGQVAGMRVERANELQLKAYYELRGHGRPAEAEDFRRKSREDAKEALETFSILPSDAQWRFFQSLLRQIGETMPNVEKQNMTAAAAACKSDCSNMIEVLKELVANRRGRHDGRRFRA